MPILEFPNPKDSSPEGILAVGGDLHPDSLLLAYRQGIFPWPIEGIGLAWFSPDPRAILDFANLHISRTLRKIRKKSQVEYSHDQAFSEVIFSCAKQPRQGQRGTWITSNLKRAYIEFHRLGFAHSVEVWKKDRLIGGIYGVAVDGVFSAESMFHWEPNASKLALLYLIELLKKKGLTWMDIQMMTPHMKQMGAKEISREAYFKKLKNTQERRNNLF